MNGLTKYELRELKKQRLAHVEHNRELNAMMRNYQLTPQEQNEFEDFRAEELSKEQLYGAAPLHPDIDYETLIRQRFFNKLLTEQKQQYGDLRIDTTTLPGVTMLVHKDQVSYFGKKHTMRSFEKVYRTIPRHTHASMHEIRGKYKKYIQMLKSNRR